MNVRFAEGEIRLRISSIELDHLLLRHKLALQIPLPKRRRFATTLHASPSQWEFASDPTGLWVSVPLAVLEAFAATLPSKTGLMHEFSLDDGGTVQLVLEVDIKKRRSTN
jgi:hypothetical protein